MRSAFSSLLKRNVTMVLCALLLATVAAQARDPLPSWNDGPAKQAIINFVKATTDKSSPKFVPPEDRIATFDQDGTTTLASRWGARPMVNDSQAIEGTLFRSEREGFCPVADSLTTCRSISEGNRAVVING